MASMSYPRSLGYSVSRLQGLSKNTFRIEASSASEVGAGKVITVTLPENSIVDLQSLRMVINDVQMPFATALGQTPAVRSVLGFAQSLFSRVEVSINGIQVSQGVNNSETAFRILRNAGVNMTKSMSVDRALQNDSLDSTNTVTGAQSLSMICSDWMSFFNEKTSTRYLDTSLTGTITLRMTLNSPFILSPAINGHPFADPVLSVDEQNAVNVIKDQSYKIRDFYYLLDCLSVNDGFYDNLIRSQLSDTGFLPINFKEYYTVIQDGNTSAGSTVRFSTASQSIDRIFSVVRASDYDATGQVCDPVNEPLQDANQPYFCRFTCGATGLAPNVRYQYFINSVPHPNTKATLIEGLSHLIQMSNKVGMSAVGNQVGSIADYRDNKFCAGISLCMDDGTPDRLTGFDSRGTNAQMSLKLEGIETRQRGANQQTNYSVLVLVETTATLRVGLGRSVEVIY